MTELSQLILLRDKLRKFSAYKKNNALDFSQTHTYIEQFRIKTEIMERITTGKGAKIFVVWAGNRAGKTEIGAEITCSIFDKVPKVRIACGTVESKLSIAVQQRKIDKLLRKSKIKYGDYQPERGFKNNIVTGKQDQNLLIRTYAQGREAIQGDDVDFWWLDEETPWDFFQEALARTADRNGVILLTFTPLMGYTRLVNFLLNEDNPLIKRYNLSILMNPFITQQAKDDWIANVDPDEIISRVDGKPHMKEGLIYKEYNDAHVIDRFDYMPLVRQNLKRWELSEGIDPHERTPHHWLRFLYDKENDVIYVVEEIKAPKESMIIEDFARLIKITRNKVIPAYCQIDTSSMKPDVITKHPDELQTDSNTVRREFSRCGIDTVLVAKDNALGIGQVKSRLKIVKTVTGEIKRMPQLYVFNDLSGVRWEFNRYAWKKFQSEKMSEGKEALNEPNKQNDHYMDILKYECIKRMPKKDIKQDNVIEDIIIDRIGY